MPPPAIYTNYDTVNDILNAARVRLNDELDVLDPLGGDVLDKTQPFTQQAFNTAWRRMQEFLASFGWFRLTKEAILQAAPPVATLDPGVQVWLDWVQYFDGANYFFAPILPPDCIQPFEAWERTTQASVTLQNQEATLNAQIAWLEAAAQANPTTGNLQAVINAQAQLIALTTNPPAATGQPGVFCDMDRILGGLAAVPKQQWNLAWEWRDDKLYLPGSIVPMDLRIRYYAFLPDFVATTVSGVTTEWFEQLVPIMKCLDCLSNLVCAEVLDGQPGMDTSKYVDAAKNAALLIADRDNLGNKLPYKDSENSKMRDRFTPGAKE